VIETIADFRQDVPSAPPREPRKDLHAERLYAAELRLDDLESRAKEQDARIAQTERDLKDALRTTEALAQRVSTVFWIASAGCALALVSVILSAVALARTLR
jgi:hypothetical protein